MRKAAFKAFLRTITNSIFGVPIAVVFIMAASLTVFFPISIKEKKIIQWREALSVKMEKNLIGSIAFDQIHSVMEVGKFSPTDEGKEPVALEVDESHWNPETLLTKKMELTPLVISRLELVDESELPENQPVAGDQQTIQISRTVAEARDSSPAIERVERPMAINRLQQFALNDAPAVPDVSLSQMKNELPRDLRRRIEELEDKGQDVVWKGDSQDVGQRARNLISQMRADEIKRGNGPPSGPSQASFGGRWSDKKVPPPNPPPVEQRPTPQLPTGDETPATVGFVGAALAVALDGPVEIFGGLGFTNESRIEIRRVSQGVAMENGKADIVAGKYFIRVNDLKGRIVGRFFDGQGRIVGEGSFDLGKMKKSTAGAWISPALVIQKTDGYLQKVASIYQLDSKKKVNSGAVLELHGGQSSKPLGADGIAEIPELAKGSTFLAKAIEPGSYPSQWISGVNDTSEKLVIPGKMLDGFVEYIQDIYKLTLDRKRLTIVFGRAMQSGKPLAGVSVQLKQTPEVLPIYFDGFVPNKGLHQTSASGFFAFVNAGEGVNTVVAKTGFRSFGYINVNVEAGIVGYGALEGGTEEREVGIRSFDAFTGDAQEIRFGLEHQDQMVDSVGGDYAMLLKSVDRWGQAIVHPLSDQYMPARYTYSDFQEQIFFPLVDREWLNEVKGGHRLSDDPDSGTVIGFVSDEDYELFVPTVNGYGPENIAYFDAQGIIVNKPAAGGGFILFNLASGLHQVVLTKSGEDTLISRITEVENENLSVLTYNE